MRVIYSRTSTDKQEGLTQKADLERAAKARGWLPVLDQPSILWLSDLGESGKKSSRPAVDQLREHVRAGRVTEVLIPSLDRLGRSMVEVCLLVDELVTASVAVHSLKEGTLDSVSPLGRFGIQIVAAFAEMEHGIISGRTKAGQQRAREQGTKSGKPIGRPKRDVEPKVLLRAWKMRSAGKSWREVSVACHVPVRTLRDKIAETQGVGKTPSVSPMKAGPLSRRSTTRT